MLRPPARPPVHGLAGKTKPRRLADPHFPVTAVRTGGGGGGGGGGGMWISATVRLIPSSDPRQLRNQRIARRHDPHDLPLAISSLPTPSTPREGKQTCPLPPPPRVWTSQQPPGFATSRERGLVLSQRPHSSRAAAQSAREHTHNLLASPPRHVCRVEPKTVVEWRDRRSRFQPGRHRDAQRGTERHRELPDKLLANHRGKLRWESTRGLQSAEREAERVAAELRELLAAHEPDRLTYLPSLLLEWQGREQELLAQVRRRCRFGSDFAASPVRRREETASASDSRTSVASADSAVFDVLATPRSRPLPESSQRPHRGLMVRVDRSSWLKTDF